MHGGVARALYILRVYGVEMVADRHALTFLLAPGLQQRRFANRGQKGFVRSGGWLVS